jgi:hypothetical protein
MNSSRRSPEVKPEHTKKLTKARTVSVAAKRAPPAATRHVSRHGHIPTAGH